MVTPFVGIASLQKSILHHTFSKTSTQLESLKSLLQALHPFSSSLRDMHRRIRQVFASLKEHTSVSCARIATVGGYCDLDLVFVKATSPDDLPLDEKYVHEIIKIFSFSPASLREFVLFFARRFSKTECWRVAIKSLLLLHRLLRSLPESTHFRTELLWARSNKYMTLHPCDFQNFTSKAAEDYTAFVRSYARLLDDAIDCLSIETFETDEEKMAESFPEKLKELRRMIEVLPQLQSLIDRVMDCRPTGAAEKSFIVQSAMKHIIRDSFEAYTTLRKEIIVILDNLMQLPCRNCAEAFDIYKRSAIQATELSEFYSWSKSMGLCGAYEYPFVERIPLIQIRALGAFLNEMWQLTESSSSSSTTTTNSNSASNLESPSTASDDENDKHQTQVNEIPTTRNNHVKCGVDMKQELQKGRVTEPLIQFEADNNWEALLEASLPVPSSCIASTNNNYFSTSNTAIGHQYNFTNYRYADARNMWQMQVHIPYLIPTSTNPFSHPHYIPVYQSSVSSSPIYPQDTLSILPVQILPKPQFSGNQ